MYKFFVIHFKPVTLCPALYPLITNICPSPILSLLGFIKEQASSVKNTMFLHLLVKGVLWYDVFMWKCFFVKSLVLLLSNLYLAIDIYFVSTTSCARNRRGSCGLEEMYLVAEAYCGMSCQLIP